MLNKSERFDFVHSYLDCALWSSIYTPEGQEEPIELDSTHSICDFSAKGYFRLAKTALQFLKRNRETLEKAMDAKHGLDYSRAGHDLWLTHNGYGSGFWDGDWTEPYAEQLTKATDILNPIQLEVGDDNKIYALGY